MLGVELDDLPWRQPRAEADRDDPARGGPGDEVEMIGDPHPEVVLQPSEDGRAEHPAQSTSIEAQGTSRSSSRR
jgi:hypothetical protein